MNCFKILANPDKFLPSAWVIQLKRMTAFKPDGHYAGIPFRVLGATVEIMMPAGSVTFKNMEQFLAWANNVYLSESGANDPVRTDNTVRQSSNLPVLAEQSNFHSLLTRAIEKTTQDPAQLRQLVYEQARFNFKRELLYGRSSPSDLVRQINEFELAVARIEASADNVLPAPNHPKKEYGSAAIDLDAARHTQNPSYRRNDGGPRTPPVPVEVLKPTPAAPFNSEVVQVQPTDGYMHDHWTNDYEPQRRPPNRFARILAAGIVATGIVLVVGVLWFLLKTAPDILVATKASKPEKITIIQQPAQPESPKLPYPIPTAYGVYVLSNNKLTELQALPISVPDPRVAMSAEISTPSETTIPDTKPAFILFRRDLANSVPQKITLRVVARLMRETRFINGKATTTNIEGSWRIRNIMRELRVSPIPGQREMVIARLDDDTSLDAGRYELALNRVGYDFTVAGPIRAPAQCLEQFQSTGGLMFNECRAAR